MCHIWECEAEGPRQSTYITFLNSSTLFLCLSVFFTFTYFCFFLSFYLPAPAVQSWWLNPGLMWIRDCSHTEQQSRYLLFILRQDLIKFLKVSSNWASPYPLPEWTIELGFLIVCWISKSSELVSPAII